MSEIALKEIKFMGVSLQVPEIWDVETEKYVEPDGRECAMIDITATEGDPRSIVLSYGPMPDGSDALMEAAGTFEDLMEGYASESDEDPICEYDFLGTTGYGFEVPTEDGLACNFICVAIESPAEIDNGADCNLFTILTTGRTVEEIDELLDIIEQNISFE
jgi:hypothetical protein